MTIKHEEQKAEDEIRGETIGMIQGMLEIKKKEISFSLINVVSWQKKRKEKGREINSRSEIGAFGTRPMIERIKTREEQ